MGWYGKDWWHANEMEQRDLEEKFGPCSQEDREAVLQYSLAPRKAGRVFSNGSFVADSGIVCELNYVYIGNSL